jgi:hypothetical protein
MKSCFYVLFVFAMYATFIAIHVVPIDKCAHWDKSLTFMYKYRHYLPLLGVNETVLALIPRPNRLF